MSHLSIDFQNRHIRFLETDGNAKSLKVKKFHVLDTHREGPEIYRTGGVDREMTEAVGQVLSKGKFTREPAGMALGSAYCIFRDVDLPFKSPEQIRKVIKFEVEGSIQIDIDELVISFFKKTETLDKSRLLVAGVRKSILARQLEVLQGRDVDPYFVDLDILCLYNALAGINYLKEHEAFMVLNVTWDHSDVLVLYRGQLVMARSIPVGVGPVCQALEHDLIMAHLPADDVESILGVTSMAPFTTDVGEVETSELLESDDEAALSATAGPANPEEVESLARKRREEFLKKLRREMLRTLTFLQADEQPQQVYLTGMGSTLTGVRELTGELFDTPVGDLDILGRIDHAFDDDEEAAAVNREIAVPLGAAYKSAGFNATKVDFRQEEVKYAKKFDQIKVPLACLVFLLLILVVLLNLEKYNLRRARTSELDKVTHLATQRLQSVLEDVDEADKIVNTFEKGLNRVTGIRSAINNENKRLGALLGREGSIPELPSIWPAWHAFFDWIDKNVDKFSYFKLGKVTIKMGKRKSILQFSCLVNTGSDESLLETGLIQVPLFSEVIPGKSTFGDGDHRSLENWEIVINMEEKSQS